MSALIMAEPWLPEAWNKICIGPAAVTSGDHIDHCHTLAVECQTVDDVVWEAKALAACGM
jgi:hypothetical protein